MNQNPNQCWVGDPVPYWNQPQYVQPFSQGSLSFDPNMGLTSAINRLAAALEKFNELKEAT